MIGEVEQAMGFGRDSTRGIYLEGEELSEGQRWRALGNAIHASVMCHIMVSALVTRGYITRDSHLIQSQPWTMDLDGPATPSLGELLERSKLVLQSTIRKAPKQKQRAKEARLMAAGGAKIGSSLGSEGSGIRWRGEGAGEEGERVRVETDDAVGCVGGKSRGRG